MNLFLVLNRTSDLFALLTREISWPTLEINFIFLQMQCIVLYVNFGLSCVDKRWLDVNQKLNLFHSYTRLPMVIKVVKPQQGRRKLGVGVGVCESIHNIFG